MPGRQAAPELLHLLAEAVVAVVDLVGALERLGAAIGGVVDVGRGSVRPNVAGVAAELLTGSSFGGAAAGSMRGRHESLRSLL